MYNVLIVDEEEHLLSALEQSLFPDRDDISITTAADGEDGLEKLKRGPVDLLISDIKMPGRIDGFQLILRAKEVAPDARVIIMTAFGSNRVQNFAERIGITHYIEKPFNTGELRDAILEILDEREGFQGVLSDLELTDIIQMLCLARRTALLHLKHRDARGRIIFEGGDIVHAEFDQLVGEEAVYKMLALRQGDIFMQSDFEPHERTITVGWQDVLFEGVRRSDEERASLGPDDDGDEDEERRRDFADDGPHTDVGMGFSTRDLERILTPEEEEEPESDSSFFSDDELREIEAATVDAASAAGRDHGSLPMATLQEQSDDIVIEGRFGSPLRARLDEDDDFRTPFQREASAIMARAVLPAETPKSPAKPAKQADGFQLLLDTFARECPGLRQTGIISPADGIALNFVTTNGGYDSEAVSAFFGDVASFAGRVVDTFDDDVFTELQVASGEEYILLRSLQGTSYLHIAVIERSVSLGVAIVLMRRFEKNFRDELERK